MVSLTVRLSQRPIQHGFDSQALTAGHVGAWNVARLKRPSGMRATVRHPSPEGLGTAVRVSSALTFFR